MQRPIEVKHTHVCETIQYGNKDTHSQRHLSHQCLKGSAANVDIPGCFWISKVALLKFLWHFQKLFFFFSSFPNPPTFQSNAQDNTGTHLQCAHTHTPSRLKSEPGGVSSISAQRAERPHDEFEASVVDVPQVDVFVGDLHGALPVDVQVGGGHQVHVETFWKNWQ